MRRREFTDLGTNESTPPSAATVRSSELTTYLRQSHWQCCILRLMGFLGDLLYSCESWTPRRVARHGACSKPQQQTSKRGEEADLASEPHCT
jgi:hypothetical protein